MTDQLIAVDETSYSDYSEEESQYSTQSLTSSIYEYRFENGRRYHAYRDGTYAFPNDEQEQDRLDIQHHIITLLLNGKLHLAPIPPKPQKILDVGTGTGIWAIDCGEQYPSAQVIGMDLSPIQPRWVPPNVEFQIDDAESEWTWAKDSFDMIHMRHLGGAIEDWAKLLKQAYRSLKPGGWIDLCEFDMKFYSDDGTLKDDSPISIWYHKVQEATEKTSRLFNPGSIPGLLEEAGFEHIKTKMIKQPLGTWPANQKDKQVGGFTQLVCQSGFEALGIALFTRVLGMDVEEAGKLIVGCQKDSRNKRIHSYAKQHFYIGQKPGGDE